MRLKDKETLKNNQNMKNYFIALTLLLTLGANAPAAAQTQKKSQQHELVDTTKQHAGLEAFSDTTDSNDAYEDSIIGASMGRHIDGEWDDEDIHGAVSDIFRSVKADDIAGMFFVITVLIIIFVLSPLVIFGLLLFFIFRNRKQKMKLAEMAMRNGQPIPDQLLNERKSASEDDRDTYKSGMRQVCLGLGLMIFLGLVLGKLGLGIGALVFFIGVGKVVIARKPMNNQDLNNNRNFTSQNHSNNNDYE